MHRSESLLAAVALALLTGALVVRSGLVPEPLPANAPPGSFSAERAMAHVRVIAERPHPSGSEDHRRVRAYIVDQLRALGLEAQLQEGTAVGTRYPAAGHVVNVLARLPGRRPGGKAVLIATHYDGVWASPAASDDGSGVAALLETLRALRAGEPLEHDVIALFSDAEEAGLLGAAAFTSEHPWARDVEVVLDFEARGTEGRSVMFETGTGNHDVARVLRSVPDVTAGSLLVTVYRSLPNDTDLSELARLGKPALNFAFVDGVERYHTAHDDATHLDPGTLQQHGGHMLALARAFGNGPLPRPVTGDAIFFDFPFAGLVVYPQTWAMPIAVLVFVLVAVAVVRATRDDRRWGRGLALGLVGILVTAGACAFAAGKLGAALTTIHASRGWDGSPFWRGVFAAAIALFALAATTATWALVRRWAAAGALHAGALIVWALVTILVTLRAPGASYLFAIPAAALALASMARGRAIAPAIWFATIVALSLLVPVVYTTAGYTLPLEGEGGMAAGLLVPMMGWLLAPHLETMAAERRWRPPALLALASLATFAFGLATVRRSDRFPTVSNLAYVSSVDGDSAWLVAQQGGAREGSYAALALGPTRRIVNVATDSNATLRRLGETRIFARGAVVRSVPRVVTDGPDALVIADTTLGASRRLTVRFRAPAGALALAVQGPAFVRALSVDGRAIDSTRYRAVPRTFGIPFTAPPDSGFIAVLELPRDSTAELRLMATSAGLPAMPGVDIPARPPNVVQSQNGDVTLRFGGSRIP